MPSASAATHVTACATTELTMLILMPPYERRVPAPVVRASRSLLPARRGFVVDDEVVGHRRAPDIERVGRRMIGRLPVDIGGNEVDIVGIFGEAAPRIAHVAEIVRTDDVSSDAPTVR